MYNNYQQIVSHTLSDDNDEEQAYLELLEIFRIFALVQNQLRNRIKVSKKLILRHENMHLSKQ